MKDLAEGVLRNPRYPPEWPYSPIDFERQDESDDSLFYSQPRLVYHIDEFAVAALTKYYARNFKDGEDVLDVCSSWVSHYPEDWRGGNVVGLGMNELELGENGRLSSYVVRDLNEDPTLPFPDGSFGTVLCTEVVEHIPFPDRALREFRRILAPGGVLIGMTPAKNPIWSLRFLSSSCPHSEPFHNNYTTAEVREMLGASGLAPTSVRYTFGRLSVAFVAERRP